MVDSLPNGYSDTLDDLVEGLTAGFGALIVIVSIGISCFTARQGRPWVYFLYATGLSLIAISINWALVFHTNLCGAARGTVPGDTNNLRTPALVFELFTDPTRPAVQQVPASGGVAGRVTAHKMGGATEMAQVAEIDLKGLQPGLNWVNQWTDKKEKQAYAARMHCEQLTWCTDGLLV